MWCHPLINGRCRKSGHPVKQIFHLTCMMTQAQSCNRVAQWTTGLEVRFPAQGTMIAETRLRNHSHQTLPPSKDLTDGESVRWISIVDGLTLSSCLPVPVAYRCRDDVVLVRPSVSCNKRYRSSGNSSFALTLSRLIQVFEVEMRTCC